MLRCILACSTLLFAFSCGSGTKPAPHANAPVAQPVKPAAPVTPELLAQQKHGAQLYARICAVCHGAKGEGYKADRASALAHPEFLASANDWFLRASIARGRTGTTMSAWSNEHGGPLSAGDIDAIVAFMRTWQTQPRLSLDERPPRGDAKRAEPVYVRECAQCHGARGVGGPNIQIGDPVLLSSVSNGFLRHAIQKGRTGTPMAAFGAKLGPEGVEDMIALIRSFALARPLAGQGANANANPTPSPLPVPPKITAPLPLGKVPLNPNGPEPVGFEVYPKTTPAKVIHGQLVRGARTPITCACTSPARSASRSTIPLLIWTSCRRTPG